MAASLESEVSLMRITLRRVSENGDTILSLPKVNLDMKLGQEILMKQVEHQLG